MTFANLPTHLALALLGLAVVFVTALYLLRPPPPRVVVPSLMHWRQILESKRKRRLWRRVLSALVSTLIVLATIAALSGLEARGDANGDLFLVVDDSATMATRTESGTTRLDLARGLARTLVDSWRGPVILADTRGVQPLAQIRSREGAHAWLDALEPGAGASHVPAPPIAPEPVDRRLVLVGDGVGVTAPPGFETLSAYQPARNVGLTAFSVGSDPAEPEPLLEITNGSPAAVASELVVTGEDGGLLFQRQLELEAGESFSARLRILDAGLAPDSLLRARVTTAGDALAADDEAELRLPGASPLRVVLATEDPDLSALVESLASVVVSRLAPDSLSDEVLARSLEPLPAAGGPRKTVVVLDGWAPQSRPEQPTLLITPPERPWLPASELHEGGALLASRLGASDHGEGADVPLFAVDTPPLRAFLPEGGFRTWIRGAGPTPGAATVPLVLLHESQPLAVVSLPVTGSTWSRSEAFPILVAELLDRLATDSRSARQAPGERRATLVNSTALEPYRDLAESSARSSWPLGPGLLLAAALLLSALELWTRATGVTE